MNKTLRRSLYAGLSKSMSIAASTFFGYNIHTLQEGESVWPLVCVIVLAMGVIVWAEYKRESSQ